MSLTAGALASANWLRSRGAGPSILRWHVEATLVVMPKRAMSDFDENTRATSEFGENIGTRLRLEIYSDEWGVFFHHEGRSSWIRVTDIAFVHGNDDFRLLPILPALKDIAVLVRKLEVLHTLRFKRDQALLNTNVPTLERQIHAWLATL